MPTEPATRGTPAPRDGLILVHAHPDDETMSTGGLIARSVAEGRRVDLVTCTGGEEGEIHDPTLDPEEARPRLRAIRRAELDCSVRALAGGAANGGAANGGSLNLHLLGYRDSGMMGTPANDRADVFWRADLDEAVGKVVKIIRETRPAVLVTYDSNGNYGHPDHVQVHRVGVRAAQLAGVREVYEATMNRDEVQRALQRDYPPLLRDAGVGGTVLIWALIDEQGSVMKTQVKVGSGHDALDAAAQKIGAIMKFTPALNRDQKVKVWIQLPIVFKTQ